MKTLTTLILLLSIHSLMGQEVVVPLQNTSNINLKKNKSTDTISLPFFDDFSKPNIFEQHFEDNYVTIDNSRSLNPPTIGTLMFDATDNNGNYYATNYNQSTYADFLTSKPIDLNFSPSDSVYLTFFYEPTGRMDPPEISDSLTLEFFMPKQNHWQQIKSFKNTQNSPHFVCVNIPITDTAFLHKGFKFRLFNTISMSGGSYPSLVGNCDYWFVDYFYINKNRNWDDTVFADVAFQYPSTVKLNNYTSVPYEHLKNAQNLNFNLKINFRNNDNSLRTIDSMYLVFDYDNSNLNKDTLYLGSYNFLGYRNLELDKSNINFNFPITTDSKLSYTLTTLLKTDSYDSTCNNTIKQNKTLTSYYAYDDGIAENGYGLIGEGTIYSLVAQKFTVFKPDILTGVAVYFGKNFRNAQAPYFYAVVWASDPQTGKPDTIMYEQPGFEINFDRLNQFQFFKFSKPIEIQDTFFIGWKKTVEDIQNVGLDINSNIKNSKFYNINGYWTASTIDGALMIRPVFGTENLPTSTSQPEKIHIKIYPNPAKNFLFFNNPTYNLYNIEIINLSGQKIKEWYNFSSNKLNISDLKSGIYIIKFSNGKNFFISKFIKSR